MNVLTPLDQNRIPTAFAGRNRSGMLDAARAGVQASFAVIGYKGRAWSIKYRGDNNLIKDERGAPVPSLDVVIVGVAPAVSKIYYQKNYVEGDDNPPDCWSLDGVAPDVAAPKKQNDLCGTCQWNQWGSRVTEAGKRAKACQDSRRLALVPLGDIANTSLGGPMLLRIPPTSLPNLANYAEFLERRSADFPMVGTRLAFDYEVAYPKLTFGALGYLSDEQANQVVEVLEDPLIGRMLAEAGPTEQAPAPAAGAEPQQPETEKVVNLPARASSPPQAAPAPPNPFVTTAPAAAAPVAAEAAPAPRGKRRAAAPPVAAPADLEGAIDELLDDNAA